MMPLLLPRVWGLLRATGVEPEFELPFAVLHQLFRPVLSYMDRLPAPAGECAGVVSDGAARPWRLPHCDT